MFDAVAGKEIDEVQWKYVFEAAIDSNEPPLASFTAGPYPRPRLVGVFAKNFNYFTIKFIVGFQAFRLNII